LLLAVVLLLAATAQAVVVSRIGDLETGSAPPFDFDQITTQCPTSVAAREGGLGYSGNSSLMVHTDNDPSCEGAYARGILHENGPNHMLEGDELSLEAAIFLPDGFYEAHTGYTDLIRVDSYVRDDSSDTPFADRAEINFASWDNDEFHVRAAHGGVSSNLIGPLSPEALPEGRWNLVELHLRLGATDGSALTELRINDQLLGSSAAANLFVGAEPLNRARFGIVSTNSTGSGDLTAYFDRATIRGSGAESPESKPDPPPAPEETGPPDGTGPPEEPGENAPEETAEGTPSNPAGDESEEEAANEPDEQPEGEPPASDPPVEEPESAQPIEDDPPPREAEEPTPTAPEAPAQEVRVPEAPSARPIPAAAVSGEAQANLGLPLGAPTYSRHFKHRASKRARPGCAKRRVRAGRRRARSRSAHRRQVGACKARCRDRDRCCDLLARRLTNRSQRRG